MNSPSIRACSISSSTLLTSNMKNQDLIQVSEAKVGRKLVEWYLKNLIRTYQ